MAHSSFLIEWEAYEYEHKERSQDWFWAVGIVTVAIIIAAIIFGNIIFAILILIAVFALSLFINRPPHEIHIAIDERGIIKENVRYPYETLRSFWIDGEHPHPRILVRSEKMLMPIIIVPLPEDIDEDDIRTVLLDHLPEEFHDIPFVERVLEYIGF